MISILSRFSSILLAKLDDSSCESTTSMLTEEIRNEMLECMFECLSSKADIQTNLWDKVFEAPSLQTLWYLRVDLMTFLSFHHGEAIARRLVEPITERFHGILKG